MAALLPSSQRAHIPAGRPAQACPTPFWAAACGCARPPVSTRGPGSSGSSSPRTRCQLTAARVAAAERPPGYIKPPQRRRLRRLPPSPQEMEPEPDEPDAAAWPLRRRQQGPAAPEQQQDGQQPHGQDSHEQQLQQQWLHQQQQRDGLLAPAQQRAPGGQVARAQPPQHTRLPQQQQQQQHPAAAPAGQPPQGAHSVQQQHQHQQQQHSSSPSAWAPLSSGNGYGSGSSGAFSATRAASAYAVVPTATAPAVAAATARAAAARQAAAAAATAAAAAGGGAAAAAHALPLAEQCVPQQFWGLMNESLRPWHKQALVHLCFCLPPPACYVYQDMRPGTMQRCLAQRAVVEKQLRGALADVLFHQRRLRGWLRTVSRKEGGSVNPGAVRAAQQELLDLKSSVGGTRRQLAQLQARAKAYSDADYLCYSSTQLEPLLQQLDALCEAGARRQVPLVLRLQEAAERGARRALFARTVEAAAAARREAAEDAAAQLAAARPGWRATAQQARQAWADARALAWRYPPPPYVLWRVKGRPGASRPPLVLPGLERPLPRVRRGVEQLPERPAPPLPPPAA